MLGLIRKVKEANQRARTTFYLLRQPNVDIHLEYCLPLFIWLYYKRYNKTGRDSKNNNNNDQSYGKASEQKLCEG